MSSFGLLFDEIMNHSHKKQPVKEIFLSTTYLGLFNSQTIEIKFWLNEKRASLSLRITCTYTILTSKELFELGDNITTTISTK